MTESVLTNGPEAYNHLLIAAQRSRSVAAEGGNLDLLSDQTLDLLGTTITVPGLDPMLGNPKTLDMLVDYQTGAKTCDGVNWLNLAYIVETSTSWQISLSMRGVRMPTRAEAIAQMGARA